jgi:carboxy-terminal domain RNA polymerase II polypeptide A small phosphatase
MAQRIRAQTAWGRGVFATDGRNLRGRGVHRKREQGACFPLPLVFRPCVLTSSVQYADPVLDKVDVHKAVTHRLFRESCYSHRGNYVKDLSMLGRPLEDCIILDNSPASYLFNPSNAVPVMTWFNDPHDTELTDLIGFLTDLAAAGDVRGILARNL